MNKKELVDLYEKFCAISEDYSAEIDFPEGNAQYDYVESCLNTLANLSERFQDYESDFYGIRSEKLSTMADEVSKSTDSLKKSHSIEAGILLLNIADEKDLDTNVSNKDFTPMNRGSLEPLKKVVEDHLEN